MARSTTFDVLAYPSASDSLSNPYIEMLYGESEGSVFRISPFSIRGAMLKKVDVVHLHWPEWTIVQSSPWKAYVRLCAFVLCMTVVRARGAAVVWTVHNLHPHRRISRVREWLLYTFLRRIVDHQVHLTEATLRIMRETGHKALPSSPVSVVPHGPLASPSDFSRRDAFRGEAGVPRDGRLLVFFGGIDRYKGVDGLIVAFRGVPGPDVRLAVCGRFADDEIAADVTDAAGPDARVFVKGGFLSDDSLADLVAGADLVVLPYAAGLNSGSLFYALSAPRQVLMPDTPTFRAVADQIGSRWIHFYEGAISADDIVAALASDAPDAPPRLVTWTSVWEQTEAAYLVAITSRKRARSA